MKVKIGKFKNYIGPYQIADKVFFWVDKYTLDESRQEQWDYKAKEWLGEFLTHGFNKKIERADGRDYWDDERKYTLLHKFCNWIYSKRKRTVKVRIDKWDTWNMDGTLAYIITPMLKQLKAETHGAPYVDDEDVPEELKSTSAPPKENDYDTDDNHFKRWDYVIDEMIWAFEQIVTDDEPDFWIEEPVGMYFEKCVDNSKLSTMKYDKEGRFDTDGYQAYQERKANGFKLFGKYYQGLWD